MGHDLYAWDQWCLARNFDRYRLSAGITLCVVEKSRYANISPRKETAKMKFFQAFQIVGTLTAWFMQANADGKITSDECIDLVRDLARQMGFTFDIEVPSMSDGEGYPKL